ncbi:hypothetical protein QOZ80_6AG0526580 [Eleusine coracana subsp. coracana]|nr:hypothetical protein QOZ80_6AG0526580 [Eleusine coracana subsp. coracana]
MTANVIQEWTPCEEEEFKGLFVETPNENPSEKMEVHAKRFPAKTMQQLSGQDHFDALGDMLCRKIDVEPSINDATSDSSDWYKLLGGETHDSVLEPSVEISLKQPSKQFMVAVAGDQVAVQKPRPRRKSTLKKRRIWSSDEHRQFLNGVQCFGRGEWKAISTYYVPSRTPAQLASHAQKYFQRIEKDDLFDKRCSINGTKLVCHDRNNTKLSGIELERVKPTESSIPQPVPAED